MQHAGRRTSNSPLQDPGVSLQNDRNEIADDGRNRRRFQVSIILADHTILVVMPRRRIRWSIALRLRDRGAVMRTAIAVSCATAICVVCGFPMKVKRRSRYRQKQLGG